MNPKSPVRVRCRTLAFGIKSCAWTPIAPFRAIGFRARRGQGSAIIHRSTKADRWQVSRFDVAGPIGDTHYATAAEALAELSPRQWRLVTFA
jgi:hypothetical protein